MRHESNSVAVITGAAGGIGQAIASALLSRGFTLALLDRNMAGLQNVQKQLASENIHIYHLDIADEKQVSDVMAKIAGDFGRLDLLINNAGVLKDGLLLKAQEKEVTHKLPVEDWQHVIDVNLTGVFLCGREAACQMVSCGQGGAIINMTSLARQGNFGQSSYAAAKAGVAALTVTWAQELARYNIRSVAIAPGVIETDMTKNMKPLALEGLCKKVPAGRLGQPDEVASAVTFILDNTYFNGRILEIDGGLRF